MFHLIFVSVFRDKAMTYTNSQIISFLSMVLFMFFFFQKTKVQVVGTKLSLQENSVKLKIRANKSTVFVGRGEGKYQKT